MLLLVALTSLFDVSLGADEGKYDVSKHDSRALTRNRVSGGTIQFDLSNYDRFNESTHAYEVYESVSSFAVIKVVNVVDDVGFFVVQVHSYKERVVLSRFDRYNYLNGTNIGFVEVVSESDDDESYNYYLQGNGLGDVRVLVVVTVYTVQGKCTRC